MTEKKSKIAESVKIIDLSACYPTDKRTVLNRLDFSALPGETVCLLGGNGCGKSTLLKVIAKIIKPAAGRVKSTGKIAYMPQHARDYFLRERVRDDVNGWGSPEVAELASRLGVTRLADANPFDLSGGEQHKCVLLAILSRRPDILLLDEPTKGMDPTSKAALGGLLNEFKSRGGTVITATHDFEFAGAYADRCAMLFDGAIVADDPAREFFADNKYYTTSIHKGLRHVNPSVVFLSDVKELWAR